MKLQLLKLISFISLVSLTACDDGDDVYVPSYITDMLVAVTDADGTVATVTLDDGTSYDVSTQGMTAAVADTLYRCRASYTVEDGKLRLFGLAHVFSPRPVPIDAIVVVKDGVELHGSEHVPRDPVKLVSMWKSGGYINLHLGVLTTDKGIHRYAFCKESDGRYSLAHQRPAEDAESYTRQVFLSMPIPEGEEHLAFSVYTYEGICTQTF